MPEADARGASPTLSVVMPVYNEAANLAGVLAQVRLHVLDVVPGSELIVVDDRSRDDSPAILAKQADDDPRITVLTNAVNRGHGPSVRAGWASATAPWILTIDSDGQVDLGSFRRLWEQRRDHDLVLGSRVGRHDPLHRKLVTFGTRTLAGLLVKHKITDANTPFKLIRRELFTHVAPVVPDSAFAPTVLLVMGALRSGARVSEVHVVQLPRLHGRSTLQAAKLARALLQCTRETVRSARTPLAPFTG